MGTVAFVVLLAGVIYWLAAFGSPSKSDNGNDPVAFQLSPEDESARLTEQGLDALASGDTSAAAEFFAKATSLDPANTQAQDELRRITATSSSGGTDTNGGGDSGDGGNGGGGDTQTGFMDPVSDMRKLLPKTIVGYELSLATALGPDATVSADPTEDGPSGTVIRALYSVHDAETEKAAQAYVTTVARTAFPQNGSDVTVDGAEGYFGTDGTRFASVSYVRGRFAFQVILTTDQGTPGSLFDFAVDAARAFPDSL